MAAFHEQFSTTAKALLTEQLAAVDQVGAALAKAGMSPPIPAWDSNRQIAS